MRQGSVRNPTTAGQARYSAELENPVMPRWVVGAGRYNYNTGYLATWNLRHIKNPRTISLIEKSSRDRGYAPVQIRTPKELRRFSMQDTERDDIMDDDPIMAELREVRAQRMAKVGNDPSKLMEYVRSRRKSPTTDCCGNPLVGLDEWASRERSEL